MTQQTLTDDSPMPFGKYSKMGKPVKMSEIPADYFFYLWTECNLKYQHSPVAEYIRKNLAALEMEYPDGIW